MSGEQPLDLSKVSRPSGPWKYVDAKEDCEYQVSVEPNKISFVDGEGQEHHVYIPTGRAGEAQDHFAAERWDELKKFPKDGKFIYCLHFCDPYLHGPSRHVRETNKCYAAREPAIHR